MTFNEKNYSKILSYEYHMNETLKQDLREIFEKRDLIYEQIAEFTELKSTVENLTKIKDSKKKEEKIQKEKEVKLRTKVDIGCNFYVQAEISDLDTITVDIGCGIWLPLTPPEVLKFCDNKIKLLKNKANFLTEKELQVKAQINIVICGMREIQKIKTISSEKQQRYEY